ncbi:hypothetical protein [Halobacillus karajensis]|nr:hypothetical protein [Halobacillus karajensis]
MTVPYRVEDISEIKKDIPKTEGIQVRIKRSGYLQKVDFIGLIKEAENEL